MQKYIPVLVAFVLPAAALAQVPGAGAPPPASNDVFSQIDANNDGIIDELEAQAEPVVSDNFDLADQDGNGELDRAEFQIAFGPPQQGGQTPGGQPPPY